MTYYPAIVILILAIADWIAADRRIKALEYFAKPATMLALLWWMWQNVGLGGSMVWFTIGVIFCLAGDIFLMIPRNLFIFGLLSFLMGHLSYILGLNNTPPFEYLSRLFLALYLLKPVAIISAVILAIYVFWLYRKLAGGLKAKGVSQLKIPVLVYAIVISLMVYSALLTWYQVGWTAGAALSASMGAVLFFASDSMLAWDRFLNPINHARLKVMITYHLGQVGIILGAMLSIAGK